MRRLFSLHLVFVLFAAVIGDEVIKWNQDETSKTVEPHVRKYTPQTRNYVVRQSHFHYKTHFGIIIEKNTTFTLKVEASEKVQELYFHCLTSSYKDTYKEISFKDQTSYEIKETALDDCVPMVSVSHNVPVKVSIQTKNWLQLPVFDSSRVTFLSSQEAEDKFFKEVQTYGFVENFYTQMLLSSEEINILKSKNYSLYIGLQNQADLVQYYDYLLGASRFINENENLGYAQMERTTMFLRREPCDDKTETSFSDRDGRSDESENRVTYDKCEDLKTSCFTHSNCGYYAYYSSHWVAIISDVSEFLSPNKGEEWVLLHEVGHNYNIAPYNTHIVGFGETGEVWNNIYGANYQHRFPVKQYWLNESAKEGNDTILNYQQGKSFEVWDWRPKLQFFMSIFGFDGTDGPLREFHIRHYQHSERTHTHFNNIVPTLLEVFLDLHNVNLLPYLQKVINFEQFSVPLVTEDLKLRLLSGHAVLPALDFGVKASELQLAGRERDFRQANPLVLLPKVPKRYVWLNIHIKRLSPLLWFHCLYLNNVCHEILGPRMRLRLLADVYSSYIVKKIGRDLYLSDVEYHTVANDMTIEITVRKISHEDIYLPLVQYTLTAFGKDNVLISEVFVNYKNMRIGLSQQPAEDSDALMIFDKGSSYVDDSILKFEIGGTFHFNHERVARVEINGKSVELNDSSDFTSFVFTPVGIQKADNLTNYDIIQSDVERIKKFMEEHRIDLSGNALYDQYLERYAWRLHEFNPDIKFPKRSKIVTGGWTKYLSTGLNYITDYLADILRPINVLGMFPK